MKNTTVIVVCLLGATGLYCIARAGSLEPPAPPGSTDRFLISQDCAVNTGCFPGDIPGYPVTITSSGSYRLTSDTSSSGTAITIESDNVTIDLMGFTMSSDSTGPAITTSSIINNIEVKNGTIELFASGEGIALPSAHNSRAIDLRLRKNGDGGIILGTNALVSRCQLLENGNNAIRVGSFSTVSGCVVRSRPGALSAIVVTDTGAATDPPGTGATIVDCTVSGSPQIGIIPGKGATVRNCTVSDCGVGITAAQNTLVVGCSVTGSLSDGMQVSAGGQITGCLSANNGGKGVVCIADAVVSGNQVFGNGFSETGAGGIVAGDNCTIDNNIVNGNGVGIKTAGVNSKIFKNTAFNNSDTGAPPWSNYVIQGTNDVGPRGTASGSVSPWANLEN